jgi:GNAT superfamily N-acetyltransferase
MSACGSAPKRHFRCLQTTLDSVNERVVDAGEQLIRVPEALYLASKDLDNHHGEGSTLLAAVRAITYFGRRTYRQFFCEPLWDYDLALAAARSNGVLADAYAHPYLDHIAIGFAIFEGAYSAPAGRLQLPSTSERYVGNHAVQLVGWDDNGESLGFLNSWGPKWGDGGIGRISRAYWNKHIQAVWLSRRARCGRSPFTADRLAQARSPEEYANAWKTENPRWKQRIRFSGHGHQLMLWESLSWTGWPAEVIEIRDGRGDRAAWCELFLEGHDVVVKEFFVWPSRRRRGYGRLLEDLCVERARARHAKRLLMWFHQQDAVPSVRRAGREFGVRLGYEWHWTREIPGLAAVGHKKI